MSGRAAALVGMGPVLSGASARRPSGYPCYEIASALIAETEAVCGGPWWTALFRGGVHSS
ncbi:MAG TPA: hypothetical protein VNF50_04395 [Acidimicrobiales bacterium]|nr:hypothetical protein [Acidimicrobiales bacterium]